MFDQQPSQEDDLLKYLADEFAATPQGDKLGKLAARGVFQFVEFAREFLNNNRPTTVFPENDNYGVTLSNNRRVIIAPQANSRGMMNSDDSIQITAQPGQDAKGLRDYTQENSMPYQTNLDREPVNFKSKKPLNRDL